ncbi:GAF and ANTAR domain-containing protein [Miltoncostaea oceani]|uniref:GAF and ANTAR domain-containing protein n=1 Tax=Miltoncostaea oceani TaxID=2843216 RepID=UPI001C3DCA81|nr:GAF and ANTAR domain-containing protein [Miltoncostaea oceani]
MTELGDRGRVTRLAAVLRAVRDADPVTGVLRASTRSLSVSGASIMILVGGTPTPLAWSGAVAEQLEFLQNGFGEGPCVDAHTGGALVSEPDLARSRSRWPAFTRAALDAGAAAVFSVPLRVGAAHLGALTVFRAEEGDLSTGERGDLQVIADIAATLIVITQASAAPESVHPQLEALASHSAVVHQASGMVSVQCGVGVLDALALLRAQAFVTDRLVVDVARDVVMRRLRLTTGWRAV